MAAILQKIISYAFSCMEIALFFIKFDWFVPNGSIDNTS